jgi:hypothetical protein
LSERVDALRRLTYAPQPVSRFAAILTLIAALLSGGGVARFVHMVAVHGGDSCTSACDGHRHADSTPHQLPHAPAQDDCPVCDELAVNTPAPDLHTAFVNAIAFLEIAHDREAAQLPAPHAPDAVSARPPPSAA